MKQDVFHIVKVEVISDNEWLVSGRAWEDIHIGDTLTTHCIDPEDSSTLPQLKVVGISTYGSEVLELNRMLTGNIILHSTSKLHLNAESMLVRDI